MEFIDKLNEKLDQYPYELRIKGTLVDVVLDTNSCNVVCKEKHIVINDNGSPDMYILICLENKNTSIMAGKLDDTHFIQTFVIADDNEKITFSFFIEKGDTNETN